MTRRRRRLVVAALITALLIGVVAAFDYASPWWQYVTTSPEYHDVTIAPGDTLSDAAQKLEQAELIDSKRHFTLLARVFGSSEPIKSGTYRLYYGEGWGEYLRHLQGGEVVSVKVTIPEGMPSILVAERLRAQDALTGDISVPAEGSILPDTYSFPVGSSRADAVARMQAAMTQALAELWPRRSPRTVVKTPEEAVILASIVEKETGKPAERRLVAAVYSNRLRLGMKLDADPTVIYPITKGKPLGRRIRLSELRADTGYNTYVRAGLPDGPIANPGRASIEAVLDPAETRALYFVADGSGGHVFAETLAEHNANVAKWYALRRARGEM